MSAARNDASQALPASTNAAPWSERMKIGHVPDAALDAQRSENAGRALTTAARRADDVFRHRSRAAGRWCRGRSRRAARTVRSPPAEKIALRRGVAAADGRRGAQRQHRVTRQDSLKDADVEDAGRRRRRRLPRAPRLVSTATSTASSFLGTDRVAEHAPAVEQPAAAKRTQISRAIQRGTAVAHDAGDRVSRVESGQQRLAPAKLPKRQERAREQLAAAHLAAAESDPCRRCSGRRASAASDRRRRKRSSRAAPAPRSMPRSPRKRAGRARPPSRCRRRSASHRHPSRRPAASRSAPACEAGDRKFQTAGWRRASSVESVADGRSRALPPAAANPRAIRETTAGGSE